MQPNQSLGAENVDFCAEVDGLHVRDGPEPGLPGGNCSFVPALCRERTSKDLFNYNSNEPSEQMPKQWKTTLSHGISNPPETHEVLIIGAGIAGLYIAMILDNLAIPNLTYQIVEASSRVGGRIYTHYFSDEKHDYYDVGAARFPDIPPMRRAFQLLRNTGVPLIPYCADGGKSCPKYFNGKFFNGNEADPYHVGEANGGSVPDVVATECRELLEREYAPYRQCLKEDFKRGIQRLFAADEFSIRDHLRHGGPDGARPKFGFSGIQWMETQIANTGFFDRGFSRGVFKSYIGTDVSWWCVDGGSALLIDTMQNLIKQRVETSKRVTSVKIDRCNTKRRNMSVHIQNECEPRTGYSTVFSTTTLPALSWINLSNLDLHPMQREAIRSIHYRDSAKIAIKFKYAWWFVHCGITGGIATTDLPLRVCVYPAYNASGSQSGSAVLLASYTQGQDASRITTLINSSDDDGQPLIDLILRDLATLHSQHITYEKIRDAYSGDYHAYSWALDPYAFGGYASFGPAQFRKYYPHLARPAAEGKFHIVGEAVSAWQGWIVGALDSAYGAVYRFLCIHEMQDAVSKLKENWGHDEELAAEMWTAEDPEMKPGNNHT